MRRVALVALAAALVVPSATAARPAGHRHRARHEERISSAAHSNPSVWPTPPVPPAPAPPPPKVIGHIQVVAREFSLTTSRTTLAPGRVAVELDNHGQDPHDLRVERADRPSTGFNFTLAKPGTVSSRRLDLEPGRWKLYCTLPGHEDLGMRAYVTVAG